MPTTRIIRPDGVVTNTGPYVPAATGVTVPATVWEAVSDLIPGLPPSYPPVTYASKSYAGTDFLLLSLGTYTLLANERCQRVRVAWIGGTMEGYPFTPGTYRVGVDIGTAWTGGHADRVNPYGLAPLFWDYGPWQTTADGAEWTQSNINAMRIFHDILTVGGSPNGTLLYEMAVELDIHTKPTVVISSPILNQITDSGLTVNWTYGGDGDPQKRFKVKVFTKAVGDDGAFNPETSTTVYDSGWIGSSAATHNIPTGLLSYGSQYYVYVRVSKDFNLADWDSDWSTGVLFKVDTRPTPDVTFPSGALTTTSRPTITWTVTDVEGDGQVAYQIKVYEEPAGGWTGFNPDTDTTDLIWDSGVVNSVAFSAQMGVDLTNLVNYRTYLKVKQDRFSLWSLWNFENFNTNYTQPPTPIFAATMDTTLARVQLSAIAQVVNLLSANESSAETDASDWTVASGTATIASTSAQAQNGTKSVQVTRTGSTGDTTITTDTGLTGFRVSPGVAYTASAYARAATTTRNFRVDLVWYDSTGAVISTSTGTAITDSSANFNARASVTGTSPETAVFAAVQVVILGAAASEVHYIDSIMVNRGSLVTFTVGIGIDTWWYEFYRSLDGGLTFEPVRGGEQFVNTGAQPIIYDYELPFLTLATYTMKAVSMDLGQEVASPNATNELEFMQIKKVWLKDVLDPLNNSQFPVEDDWLQIVHRTARAEYEPLGRTLPVVVRGTAKGEKLSATFTILGTDLFNKIMALVDSDHILLLQTPKRQWYVEISGDVTVQEFLWDDLRGETHLRKVTIPFTEVEKP